LILKEHLPKNLIVTIEEDEPAGQDELDIEIKGIDIDAGLSKCDRIAKDYLEILDIFAEYGPDKATEIESFAAVGDYDNYVIAVHALKSVAANIGAHQLFTMAKVHEFAGKSGNTGFIDSNCDKLVTLYRDVIGNIRETLSNMEEKEQ
ncbi:MAG: Hpt domain-containing protein, partial [Lachnospiraceae bacterium]|nr:Hpt domain-containing protein [Lachnospiraceae bacterium]